MDETIESPQDGTNPESEVIEETTVEETVETPEVKTYSQAEWDELHGRTKKAEAELKTFKVKPATASPQPNVEEVVLLANGMPEDLLSELKAVAAVRKTSLIKAQNDPIFVAVREKFEKDLKTKAANVPASRGAGNVKPKKDFNSPGLTREEHRAMVLGQ